MAGLMPNEHVIESVNAGHKKDSGVLFVTNMRLLWKKGGDNGYTINIDKN